jgi:hypothetical protein
MNQKLRSPMLQALGAHRSPSRIVSREKLPGYFENVIGVADIDKRGKYVHHVRHCAARDGDGLLNLAEGRSRLDTNVAARVISMHSGVTADE